MNQEIHSEFLALRKALISEEFLNLNEMQRQAVLATEGPLLVLAGAGSGKTTVLINRIYNLIKYGSASDCDTIPFEPDHHSLEQLRSKKTGYYELLPYNPVPPWRILAITFTNKAASELKERLQKKLGAAADDIWACTFHSACVKILRKEAVKLGYTSDFSIYDTDDSISLIKQIEKDLDLDSKDYSPRSVLFEISNAKSSMVSSLEYTETVEMNYDYRKKKIASIYTEYCRRMFIANAVDFDDLIQLTVKVLKENPESLAYWQKKFKYVLIDEYQDTNKLQYMLASLLSGDNHNLCVVGDDDQSIYKFRGATIENILSFENSFPGCRTIRLEQNYRSTSKILDAANSIISNNASRKGKTLWTKNEDGDPISMYLAEDQMDEAEYVSGKIIEKRSGGDNWKDNAVLYRMNAQSSQFEIAFKRRGIPYKVIGGTKFFERTEIKDILSYLSVIASPDDDLRLTRIINVPPRGIGAKSVEALRSLAIDNNCSMFRILQNISLYPSLQRASQKLSVFYDLLIELIRFSECNTSDSVYDYLIEKTGYIRSLEEKHTFEDQNRIENVKELKTGIFSYIKETGDTTLNGYLADIALYTDIDNMNAEDDAVLMMTVHSAKGLEFPHVYLSGMEETIFPGIRSLGDQEELEEERRLCYVAVTRAKKSLCITSAKQRMIFGKTVSNRVSRFVEEIPKNDIITYIPKSYSYYSKHDPDHLNPNRINKFDPIKAKINELKNQNNEIMTYAIGDEITHKSFGDGIITSMKPMGGDFLIEINFVQKGSKKLMLKAASAHMSKRI